MRRSILMLAAASLPLALIACGSSGGGNTGGTGGGTGGDASTSSSSTTTSSSSSTTTSSSSSGSSGTCSVTGMTDTCENACDALFECGILTCGGATQLCPSFGPNGTTKDQFVAGCVPGCTSNMALKAIVNPSDCNQTISFLSGANMDFKMACGN